MGEAAAHLTLDELAVVRDLDDIAVLRDLRGHLDEVVCQLVAADKKPLKNRLPELHPGRHLADLLHCRARLLANHWDSCRAPMQGPHQVSLG